ncbi:MAG: hypothetical protein JWM34_796 [Ilumatobacteraceae bacterium]|nr:hypothetical protein [Ilumatobacteraceae bacterium]
MNVRRTLVVIVVIAGFAASIIAAQHTQAAPVTRFGTVPFASRPYASHSTTAISTTWYCPGVPASDATVGGQFVVANPTDVPINGSITYYGPTGTTPVVQQITAPPRDKLTLDAEKAMTAQFVSATVELEGGEGIVEQRAVDPAGAAVASCTTQTSSTWYFADGWTSGDSSENLIIANPYDTTVNVDVSFFDKTSKRTPGAFQGDSIDPHSVKVISVADSGFRDETIIGIEVDSSRGRLIVSREQHYTAGGRIGYSLNLGAPNTSEQLWFVEGDHDADVTEQYVILNPGSDDSSVDVTVLGVPVTDNFVQPDTITVPADSVVTFDTADISGLPNGAHSMVFSTLQAPPLVIERVLTKPSGSGPVTSVVMGMTPEYVQPRWYIPIGVDAATDAAIVVYNPDQEDKKIAVKAIGPGGEVAVPSLAAVDLPAAAVITIPLTDPAVFGKVLVVEGSPATNGGSGRIFVERKLPRGDNLAGRSGSWALPECGPCNFFSPPSS